MFRKMIAAVAMAGLLGATPVMAASACRDTKGKYIKCPNATAKQASSAVAKGKDGKCRYQSGPKKGQFTKCP